MLKDDLLHPSAYAGYSGPVDRVETHISWVFLTENDAYKVKRPVSLGFLDFTSLESRRQACEAEVELNSRLAPSVYLGIEPVRLGSDGRHRLFGDGAVVDWAVHMLRLPDAERGDVRVQNHLVSTDDIERLANLLADFHGRSRSDLETARFGTIQAIEHNVQENFVQAGDAAGSMLTVEQFDEIKRWQTDFLAAHRPLFEARAKAGRIRDGHGDLRLDHVYWRKGGEISVIDCIEFNERFRYADVCADVAFLSMDFADHGRVDLGELLLAYYAKASNDYDLFALVDFYQSYRAFIRGKVLAMLANDPSVETGRRERAWAEARRYFLLALASGRPVFQTPVMIAVGGLIASGKTTVANALAKEIAAPSLEADRTRKYLLGVPPTQNVREGIWQGAYALQFSEKVYAELIRRADVVLASGRSVILDASFRSRNERERARELAGKHGVPFWMVEVRCEKETARERLERRTREGGVSDARWEIFDRFAASFETITEIPAAHHVVVDTDRPLDMIALRKLLRLDDDGFTR